MTVKPNGLPAVTLDGGWVVITNREAASGVTVTAVVVAGKGQAGARNLQCVAAAGLVRIKPEIVATPFFAVAFDVPVSVPPLGPDARVTVSLPLKLVATLPY